MRTQDELQNKFFSPGNNACQWVVKGETTQCKPGSEKWSQLSPASPSSALLLIFSVSSNKWNFPKLSQGDVVGIFLFIPLAYLLLQISFFFFSLRDRGKNKYKDSSGARFQQGESQQTLSHPSHKGFTFLPRAHTRSGIAERKPDLSTFFFITDAKSFSVKDWLNVFLMKYTIDTPMFFHNYMSHVVVEPKGDLTWNP